MQDIKTHRSRFDAKAVVVPHHPVEVNENEVVVAAKVINPRPRPLLLTRPSCCE
jgi:hypothetical protein